MLYNNLLFFLGIYSWKFKPNNLFEKIIHKKEINLETAIPLKKNKLINPQINSNSPNVNFYLDMQLCELNNTKKFKIYLYNLYYFLILLFLFIQPTYLFIKMFTENNLQEYLITFLININTPFNYMWSKYYFTTNHFDSYVNCCGNNCSSFIIFILFLTVISILISFINIEHFYNEYYYINDLPQFVGIFILIIEWIYARLIFTLDLSIFTIVLCKHKKEIFKFIKELELNELDLEDCYCLSSLISNIGHLRHKVEISISFYNILLSFNTITGGISLALFINELYNSYNEINNLILKPHELYLLQSFIVYIICQLIFFYNVINYSSYRDNLFKKLKSSTFINKFLIRWSTSKLKRKCGDKNEIKHLNKMILCIEQETATSIDWIILEKLTQSKWMDFSILGISTQDGSLIKKVITFSSLIYFILGYF